MLRAFLEGNQRILYGGERGDNESEFGEKESTELSTEERV